MGTDREATEEEFDEDALLEELYKLSKRRLRQPRKIERFFSTRSANIWERIDRTQWVT
jgi:hypothetical protein